VNSSELVDPQGWDTYWTQKNSGGYFYAAAATLYRVLLFRPYLSYILKRHFKPQTRLLHAGCGSGQVDAEIPKSFRVTALDISPHALEFYKRSVKAECEVVPGSILDLPFPEATFDGIYNLGVMEHFSWEEIGKILSQFHRILVPQGRIVLFWPPENGLTVRFFKIAVWLGRKILNKELNFHPPEPSRIQSVSQVTEALTQHGFKLVEYRFGPRDLFTYGVVVAERI